MLNTQGICPEQAWGGSGVEQEGLTRLPSQPCPSGAPHQPSVKKRRLSLSPFLLLLFVPHSLTELCVLTVLFKKSWCVLFVCFYHTQGTLSLASSGGIFRGGCHIPRASCHVYQCHPPAADSVGQSCPSQYAHTSGGSSPKLGLFH